MDLTTLSYLLILVFGFLGADAIMHHPDVILEGEATTGIDKTTVNVDMVTDILKQEVERISATPTVMTKPVIRVGRLEGIAMSLSEALKLQSVAYALQAQVGYRPDEIKIRLFTEGGVPKVLVTGTGRKRMTSFQQQVTLEPGETLFGLVQRSAVIGMAHIDPYLTALSDVQLHADDKDFSRAEAIIKFALAGLPPTPESFDRSLFENLNGLIALFRDDAKTASEWFARAEDSCPDNTVADAVTSLNVAFTELQLDHDQDAVGELTALLRDKPPTDKILLGTAYMTLAAAQLGIRDHDAADLSIAKAIEVDPDASAAYELWSDVKREQGDVAQAEKLHRKAMETSDSFENYGEIAALYFRLAWRDNQPVMRSPFTNPSLGAVHAASRAP